MWICLVCVAYAQTTTTSLPNIHVFHVRSGLTYNGDGSTWAAATSTNGPGAFNELPTSFVRNGVYYIADGTYGSHTFSTAVSGTSYIYIVKATVSQHGSSTGWVNSYGDGEAVFTAASGAIWTITTGYWDFDGITGGGPTSWTSGHGISIVSQGVSTKCVTLSGTAASNIYLSHIEMSNSLGVDTDTNEDGIYGASAVTNINISYCYLHDFGRCHILTRAWDGIVFEYNYLTRNSSSAISHGEPWSDQDSDNVTIRYNSFVDVEGTGILVTGGHTGHTASGWRVYGNLFYQTSENTSSRMGPSKGVLTDDTGPLTRNWWFYNNTIYGYRLAEGSSSCQVSVNLSNGEGNLAYNNIWYNNTTAQTHIVGATGAYNNCYLSDDCSATYFGGANDVVPTSEPNWFTAPLTYDFTLAAATTAGTTLASPYNSDMAGNTRGADGVWDRGAYEYNSGITTTTTSIETTTSIATTTTTSVETTTTVETTTSIETTSSVTTTVEATTSEPTTSVETTSTVSTTSTSVTTSSSSSTSSVFTCGDCHTPKPIETTSILTTSSTTTTIKSRSNTSTSVRSRSNTSNSSSTRTETTSTIRAR